MTFWMTDVNVLLGLQHAPSLIANLRLWQGSHNLCSLFEETVINRSHHKLGAEFIRLVTVENEGMQAWWLQDYSPPRVHGYSNFKVVIRPFSPKGSIRVE
jgi:hypothetical protein